MIPRMGYLTYIEPLRKVPPHCIDPLLADPPSPFVTITGKSLEPPLPPLGEPDWIIKGFAPGEDSFIAVLFWPIVEVWRWLRKIGRLSNG